MSDTQAKATPSKAAMELADKIFPDPYDQRQRVAAKEIIQAYMADLLKSAERREWLLSRIIDDLPSNKDWLDPSLELEARNDTSLKSALEPWKPGE